MGNNPIVSVVIIFYNAERFIREAIESVFAQSYTDWELLLVDDGSTDGSTGIAREYERLYPGKVYYHDHEGHGNRGMSASRNLGVKRASGRYVAFLDADDLWFPNKLEEQVAILGAQPNAAMVCGATLFWYGWTGNPEDLRRDYECRIGSEAHALLRPPEMLLLRLSGTAIYPGTNDVLMLKEAFDEVGGFEESFTGMYEDQVFFTKLSLKHSILVTHNRWALYRQHPDSCCSVAKSSRVFRRATQNYLEWVESYLRSLGTEDAAIWRALRGAKRRHRFPFFYQTATFTKRQLKRMRPSAIVKSVKRRLKMDVSVVEGGISR